MPLPRESKKNKLQSFNKTARLGLEMVLIAIHGFFGVFMCPVGMAVSAVSTVQ
jgi:hypothetical protein